MTDLLDEISHDIKSEKYERVVYMVTRIFIALVAVILIGVTIYVWKENTSEKLQKELSILYNKALLASDNNQLDQSIQYFDQIIEYPSQQYAALAYLNKAAILMKQQKYEEAQKTLLEINNHKHLDLAFRELAQVVFLSNQLAANQINNDDNINNEFFDKLTKENKPWKLLALQLHSLYKLKQNNLEDAKDTLTKIIQSPEANKTSKDIASSILSSITNTEIKK